MSISLLPAQIISRLCNFLDPSDQWILTLSNKSSSEKVLHALYQKPIFARPRSSQPPIAVFNRFLVCLHRCRYADTVKTLSLEGVEETIYDRVASTRWLYLLIFKLNYLETLNLSECQFLTDAAVTALSGLPATSRISNIYLAHTVNLSHLSLPRLLAAFPRLVTLTLASSKSASETSLLRSMNSLKNLGSFKLDECQLSDAIMRAIAENLSQLHTLSLRGNCALTDNGLFSIASSSYNTGKTLNVLNLSACRGLTNRGMEHLGLFIGLQVLDITDVDTKKVTLPINLIKHLFIDTPLAKTLNSLSLPHPLLSTKQQIKFELQDAFRALRALTHLKLTNINENTASNLVQNIAGVWVPTLRRVELVRDGYTRDYIVTDMYTQVQESVFIIDDAFVKRFEELYGRRCRMTLESIVD